MNKMLSRLMMGSAFVSLAIAMPISGAQAVVPVTPPSPCTGPNSCPQGGGWSISSGPVSLDSGGLYTATSLSIAPSSGDSASVSLSNASTFYDDAIVGDGGVGYFDNNNSTHTVSGNLILGNQSTGVGYYTIEGNGAQTNISFVPAGNTGDTIGNGANGALVVGNAGIGVFAQGTGSDSGNQVNVAGDLTLGYQNNGTSQGTYYLNSGTLSVGGQLSVGGASTLDNVFNQNGGSVILTNATQTINGMPQQPDYVGLASGVFTGKLTIGGGINSDPSGANSGGNGTYNLFAGSIDTTGNGIEVGPSGTGVMNQYGGTVNTTYLTMGFSGTGTYNLQGDSTSTVTAVSETVGYAGTGTFNQSGGVNTVGVNSDGSLQNPGATALEIGLQYGSNSPGNGTYNLTGGVLNAGNTVIGDGEQGSFVQSSPVSDPIANITGNLTVGGAVGGTGSYSITGDQSTLNVLLAPGGNGSSGVDAMNNPIPNPNGALIVGDAGTGTFVQGGDPAETVGPGVNVAGDLVLGHQYGSQGTYTLNNGALSVDGSLVVGSASQSNNQFIQNGGSVTLTNNAPGNPDYTPVTNGSFGNGVLYVGGENPGDSGVGTYTMNAGSLSAGTIVLGFSGTGTFNQSGGTVSAGFVDLGDCGGCNGGNSAGFYNISGTGTLTTGGLNVGDFGHGEFTQSGSASLVTVNGTLSIANGATAQPNFANTGSYDRSGTYTLNDGTLNTQTTVVGADGKGTFNQLGGTQNVSNLLDIGKNYDSLNGPLGSGTTSNIIFGGPAPGTYNMSGGSLNVGTTNGSTGIIVGDAGTGTFNQTGGNVTVGVAGGNRADLVIGNQGGLDTTTDLNNPTQAGGHGTYNLGQTGQVQAPTLQVYGDVVLGSGSSALGQQPAIGTLAVAGDGTVMNVNQYMGYDSHNGGNIIVGLNGSGTFTQTDASSVYMDHDLVIGANSGGTGTATVSAASLGGGSYNLTVGSDLNIGGALTDVYGYKGQTTADGGTGTFTLTSGDVNVIGSAQVGNNAGTGTLNVSGGTFTAGGLNVGNNDGSGDAGGTGTVNVTGPGAVTINGNADIGAAFGTSGSLVIGTGTDSPSMAVNDTGGTGNLTIGDAGAGYLTINSGTLTVTNTTQVGVNGVGSVIQNGGSFTTGVLDLSVPGGSGSSQYTMYAGTLHTTADLNVGGAGAGPASFNQSGNSTVQVDGTLRVGNTNANASYTIGAGTLTVNGSAIVGLGDFTGTFNQSGGTVTAASLTLGQDNGSTGTYNLTGGTLNDDAIVGDAGTGTFNNTGAVQNVTGSLTLGNQGTGNGTYNLTAAGTTTVSNFTTVGNAGTGIFLNDASTHNTQNLVLATQLNSSGTYTLQDGGQLTVGTTGSTGFADIGEHGTGTFTQSDATSSSTFYGALDIGRFVGGTGTVNLNAGSMTVSQGFAVVGDSGTGTFNQYGSSTMNVSSGGLSIGRGESNEGGPISGTGTYNLSGSASLTVTGGIEVAQSSGNTGTMNQGGASTVVADTETVGDGGVGIWNQNGGTNTVGTTANPGELALGASSGGTGTYNNNGATNIINGILVVGAAGTGTYNLGNGTPGAALSVLGTGLSGGNVYVGETGTGTLTASDASTATIANVLEVGGPSPGETTANGTVTVTGTGTSVTVGGQTQIGPVGTGTLNVLNGGYLESDHGASPTGTSSVVAAVSGSNGTVTVDGTGSEWNNTGALLVGLGGTGSLTISNGGLVIDNASNAGTAASVGSQLGSSGTVTLSGGTWTNTGNVIVGDAGTGTFNQSGGTAGVTGNLTLGNSSTGTGNATISGGGLTVGGNLVVDLANTSAPSSFAVDGGAVTVTGGITVNSSGTPNGSSLTVSSGSLSAATITNNDLLAVTGGTVTAAVTNNQQFNFQGGQVVGSITNAGTTTTSSGGTATVTGTFTNTTTGITKVTNNSTLASGAVSNSGKVTVDSGSKLNAAGSTYTQYAGSTKVDGEITATTTLIDGGLLEGTGIVMGDLTNDGGTVKPGDSPGTLTVTGNYAQQNAGTFQVDIDAGTPGQTSLLDVAGSATLAGTLDVELLSGSFAIGQDYTILEAGQSIANDFTAFSYDGLACSSDGADLWNCGLGIDFQEQFAGGLNGSPYELNLLLAQEPGNGGTTGVPEPLTIGVFGVGLAGLRFVRRKKATRKA